MWLQNDLWLTSRCCKLRKTFWSHCITKLVVLIAWLVGQEFLDLATTYRDLQLRFCIRVTTRVDLNNKQFENSLPVLDISVRDSASSLKLDVPGQKVQIYKVTLNMTQHIPFTGLHPFTGFHPFTGLHLAKMAGVWEWMVKRNVLDTVWVEDHNTWIAELCSAHHTSYALANCNKDNHV